ncbi:MAG: bifunctional UDP-N-acetylmuramoyl-tripeptide:D-alanyl-D-alanine ligase/alanine racemase [Paludibacter sp.]|jgi:alanine racemase|nr:bifunctional UDP-N-acetylmuramoyl-tripeptide:D-alanyl-D-alanine ligase/alanine racemase [Paludibacter sp.]
MKINRIAEIINSRQPDFDAEISELLTDSRSLTVASETLFFALVTARNDGHIYIRALYEKNVRCYVVSKILPEFSQMPDAIFLEVPDTFAALQTLVAAHRTKFNIPIVGITGSNGKTIVKEWLYQLLRDDLRIVRSPRSYNSQIGVPLSVWKLDSKAELGIFEAGISTEGEMAKLQNIIRPTIGIFTNLGDAHQENFQSLKQKAQEKLKLFAKSDVLIYNNDNKLLDIVVKQSGLTAQWFSWGVSPVAIMQIMNIEKTQTYSDVILKYDEEQFTVSIPFIDDASVENALHCVATMLYLKISPKKIAKKIKLLEPVAMRLEVKDAQHNCLLINDMYNSDINSLSIALDFMNSQAVSRRLQCTVILSDILQSGFKSEELYQTVADLLKNHNISHFLGIGTEISKNSSLFAEIDSEFFPDTESFLQSARLQQFSNEIILLKAARTFRFERISAKLEKVAHETVMEINLNSLVDNLNYFRSHLRPETKVMSMVKAFAYGSGAVEVARTLQHHHTDYLAVAVADEGAELRSEGIHIPIVVMNPEKAAFEMIFDNRLEPEIYSFRLLNDFIAAARRNGINDYPIHLKIDTGMHRLGFEPAEIEKLVEIITAQNAVKPMSVFSHLAAADDSKFDDFTAQQIACFKQSADIICSHFSHKILQHILNSAGIERFAQYQFDMVRLGIGHYGISTIDNVKLKNVCSLRTVILQIKTIQAGETVGYGRNGKLTRLSRIAILPIGYADGYNRRLGNSNAEVYIKGKRAKIVGNVCMDLIMADVTDIEALEGDIAEIFGENIPITELADKLQTIPYEILTGISRRVKRVYFRE